MGGSTVQGGSTTSAPVYRSPYAVAYSPDGATLAVSDTPAGELVLLDPKTGKLLRTVKLKGQPKGLAWSGAAKIMVVEYDTGNLQEVDTTTGAILRSIDGGQKPTDVAMNAERTKVLTADFGLNDVDIIEAGSVPLRDASPIVAPYPFAIATVGNTAVVTHLLASGDASKPDAAASVTVLGIASKSVDNIKLPPGSTSVRGVRCSPDGKWAYVVHTL